MLAKHNTKVIAKSRPAPTIDEGCHCQDKPACPLPGKCHTPGVVYKATVTITDPGNNNATETYTGLTGGPFRKRHYGHVDDMKEENKDKPGTTLSRHIHKLRREGKGFTISWDSWRGTWLDTTSPARLAACACWRSFTSSSPPELPH